jgi:hypothetical protein
VGVHESDGGFAGDGDVERVAAARQRRPLDADVVQGVGKELPDVVGLVGEEIPGVLIALALTGDEAGRPVRDATAIGVDEPADEFPRMSVDDFLLPGFEDDRALVLLAGAVLGEEAGPVLAVSDDRDLPDCLDPVRLLAGVNGFDGGSASFDEAWPSDGACDAENVARSHAGADAAVTEVEPQEVTVGRRVGGWLSRWAAS